MSDNMKLWQRHCTTPTQHVKDVAIGARKFKAIDPQFQLQTATEEWGPYGSKWGIRDLDYTVHTIQMESGPRVFISLVAVFYAPDISFPISDEMWLSAKSNDDVFKKLLTSCRSKALSLLGFSADVFLGMYDDAKYVHQRSVAEMNESEQYAELEQGIDQVKTHEQYDRKLKWLAKITADGVITSFVHQKLKDRLETLANKLGFAEPPDDTDPKNVFRAQIKQMKVSSEDLGRLTVALTEGKHKTVQSLIADPVALEVVVESLQAKYEELQLWIKVRESLLSEKNEDTHSR